METDSVLKKNMGTSGQDGGIGRHTVPPHTTKRRTTTIYKEKTTRTDRKSNCMEVGQPELTEKHSSRLTGGAETGSWTERTRGKAVAGGPG